MKIPIFILIILILSALIIISNNSLTIYQEHDAQKFSELYFDWLNKIYLNMQKITGEAVGLNWSPE